MNKRNTQQKELIATIVKDACNHPTAEMVYEVARESMPAISLGTVYRVLKDLVKDGELIEVSVPSAPSRFDKTTRTHAHFVCSKCGRLEDAWCDEHEFASILKMGGNHNINHVNIILEGVCENCK